MSKSTLVLMTRFPEAGKVKTRLIPAYGKEGALALHKCMTEFTFKQALNVCSTALHVHHNGALKDGMEQWLSPFDPAHKALFFPQVQGDLGEKIFAALHRSFRLMKEPLTPENTSRTIRHKIIIIGSDCPENRSDNMENAFALLDKHDCVLGPSKDGGYYLIGFCIENNNFNEHHILEKIKSIFTGIDWGTEHVMAQSLAKIHECAFSPFFLPMLSDVDMPEDVPQSISVIIPTLNEEENLSKLLSQMPKSFATEIIVADANSHDKTCEIAEIHGATCMVTEKGRAQQMLAAAKIAQGEILFFLHADSILPKHWDSKIRHALADTNNSLGYFRFGIIEKFWTRSLIEQATYLRCKLFALPYGDQGLFVRKKDFLQWNLPSVPILEDVYLVKKARKHGRLAALPDVLYTSGRRWFKHGFVRTSIINLSVLLCAKLGMNLKDIHAAYVNGINPLFYQMKTKLKHKIKYIGWKNAK